MSFFFCFVKCNRTILRSIIRALPIWCCWIVWPKKHLYQCCICNQIWIINYFYCLCVSSSSSSNLIIIWIFCNTTSISWINLNYTSNTFINGLYAPKTSRRKVSLFIIVLCNFLWWPILFTIISWFGFRYTCL